MLSTILLFTIFTILCFRLWSSKSRNPRGPMPLPLIGNLHQIAFAAWKTGGIVEMFNHFKKHYGPVYTLYLGPLPTVYISDFDVAHETHIKRANTFGKRFVSGALDYIRAGRGLLMSNGEFWQEHRRFALQTLRNFGMGRNLMEEKIMDEYRYRLDDYRKTNWRNGGIEVHANSFVDLLVGSVINQLLISERFEQDDQEFEELKWNLGMFFENLSLVDVLMPLPLLTSRLMRWRARKTLDRNDNIFAWIQKTIRKRVDAIEQGRHVVDGDADFVDAFLLKMEADKEKGAESSFDLETLAIDMYDLWIGGQETTSTTLCWALACLLNHPEVVKKAREELKGVTDGERALSLTDRAKTPYFNAVTHEAQRIASILNLNIYREMEESSLIEGEPIAAGTVFITQMSMIHTDEQLFKDYKVFRPERFLEHDGLEKKLIPFGIGKRACLGEALARAEIYLILGNIILEYHMEPVDGVPALDPPFPMTSVKRAPSFNVRFVRLDL